jgi:hypothetical protein
MTTTTQPVPPFPPSINPGDLQATANLLLQQAEQYLARLGAVRFYPPTINPNFPVVTDPPKPLTLPTPDFLPLEWSSPEVPAPFNGTLNIDTILPPPFSQQPPVLVFPSAPTAFNENIPDAPPVDLNFEFPTLSYTLPAPPKLLDINTVNFDPITIPDFNVDVPELVLVPPDPVPYGPESMYSSPELTFYQATLRRRVEFGGTGLPAAIENAIWERAREREHRQKADATAELDRMESMGFAFPPGVFLDAKIKIETELAYNIQTASRDIMIKQAELELENILKSLEQMNAIEGKLIDFTNSMNQRAFEACKYTTEALVSIYNAEVQAYTARVRAYEVMAQVYEARIRGLLAKVEVYKAQIAAEQAKADINRVLVEQYKIETEIVLTAVDVYKAQLGAIQTRAEIEKTKVEVYGEQIKAFGSKVNAYTAQVEGFKATVSAEATKQEAFRSQVQVYSATVDAAAKQIDAKIAEFKAKIDGKSIEYEGYKATLQGLIAKAQAQAQFNEATAEAYKAEIQGLSAYNEALIKEWQAVIDTNMRIAEVGVKSAEANVQAYIQSASIAADAAKVGAQVAAQLGAAALNAVHYSQSASWSGSISESSAESKSESKSEVKSLSV